LSESSQESIGYYVSALVNPTALALAEAATGSEEWFMWHCKAIAFTQPRPNRLNHQAKRRVH